MAKKNNVQLSEPVENCNQSLETPAEAGRGEIIIYNPDDSIRLEVRMEQETVWLDRTQMSVLFDRDKKTIGKHINTALEEELKGIPTVANFEIVQLEGDRRVKRTKDFYNLDMILSVGYRVHSSRGIAFRRWANTVLKEYLIRGYAFNPRLEQLEQRVAKTEEKIDFFVKTALPPVDGIFFDGQIYDAYEFICGLIKRAKTRLVLIDNYVDDTVLTMLDKRDAGVSATIYTMNISQQLSLDISKHNAQYPTIDVKEFKKSHDRFLILDNQVYLIGASLKDLGKKWFAVSLLSETDPNMLLSQL